MNTLESVNVGITFRLVVPHESEMRAWHVPQVSILFVGVLKWNAAFDLVVVEAFGRAVGLVLVPRGHRAAALRLQDCVFEAGLDTGSVVERC